MNLRLLNRPDAMAEDWIDIGRLSDIPRRGARRLRAAAEPIAVFRTADDEVFAVVDRCPHRAGPLSEGIVSGRTVACPLHNWVIDLAQGCAHAPDEGSTRTIPVRTEGERIFIWIELLRDHAAEAVSVG